MFWHGWDHIPEDQSHDSAGPAETQPQLYPPDTLDMAPKGIFPYYPALKHLLLNYHLNIISACRYGRTFPKTGLQSGYLMLYEVTYGKSSWVVKKLFLISHIYGIIILYMIIFYIGGPLFDILQYRKECKPRVGNHITWKKKGLWSAAMLISSMKRQQD